MALTLNTIDDAVFTKPVGEGIPVLESGFHHAVVQSTSFVKNSAGLAELNVLLWFTKWPMDLNTLSSENEMTAKLTLPWILDTEAYAVDLAAKRGVLRSSLTAQDVTDAWTADQKILASAAIKQLRKMTRTGIIPNVIDENSAATSEADYNAARISIGQKTVAFIMELQAGTKSLAGMQLAVEVEKTKDSNGKDINIIKQILLSLPANGNYVYNTKTDLPVI